MGDRREEIIAVGEPTPAADDVRAWLRRAGWATPGAEFNDYFHADSPSDTLALPGGDRNDISGLITVVETEGDDRVWYAGEGTSPAACRQCGTRLDDETSMGFWSQWSGGGAEPLATCAACGWSALLGDWDVLDSIVVGSPAIVIDAFASESDPGVMAERLRSEIIAGLGGRWAHVHLEV